jgi:hypothetical protein
MHNMFVGKDIATFNKVLANCIYNSSGAKLQSPKGLGKSKVHVPLVKVTYSSVIFGFIDDMTLQIKYDFEQKGYFTIYAHSELRVGKGDLGMNIAHNEDILVCLDDSKDLSHSNEICNEN